MAPPPLGVVRRSLNDVEDAHGAAEVAPELTADGRQLFERCQPPMVAGDLRRRLAERAFDLFEEVARQGWRPVHAKVAGRSRLGHRPASS